MITIRKGNAVYRTSLIPLLQKHEYIQPPRNTLIPLIFLTVSLLWAFGEIAIHASSLYERSSFSSPARSKGFFTSHFLNIVEYIFHATVYNRHMGDTKANEPFLQREIHHPW